MKRSVEMQLIEMALTFGVCVLLFRRESIVYIGFLLFLQFIIGIILLLEMNKTDQLMKYLVQENKKRKEQQVVWDGDEQEKLKLVQKRVELSVLQNQINPHFLYNTLDSIRGKALLDNHIEIASMTEILSKFFRYCITNDESLVTFREEINHINDYYYIQKYRFEDRITMEIWLETDEIYDLYLPKMTMQPLIENAMIHGLEKLTRHGRVTIRIIQTQEKVVITILDNGAGMTAEQLEVLNSRLDSTYLKAIPTGRGHNGIALGNINARIKLTFGSEYGIHYRSLENAGTEAVVILPRVDGFRRVKYNSIL